LAVVIGSYYNNPIIIVGLCGTISTVSTFVREICLMEDISKSIIYCGLSILTCFYIAYQIKYSWTWRKWTIIPWVWRRTMDSLVPLLNRWKVTHLLLFFMQFPNPPDQSCTINVPIRILQLTQLRLSQLI